MHHKERQAIRWGGEESQACRRNLVHISRKEFFIDPRSWSAALQASDAPQGPGPSGARRDVAALLLHNSWNPPNSYRAQVLSKSDAMIL